MVGVMGRMQCHKLVHCKLVTKSGELVDTVEKCREVEAHKTRPRANENRVDSIEVDEQIPQPLPDQGQQSR